MNDGYYGCACLVQFFLHLTTHFTIANGNDDTIKVGNGWCHTWMMPLIGGTVVCIRDITAKAIYQAVSVEKVSHFGGAPIVLNMIVNASKEDRLPFDHRVSLLTAGAPPRPRHPDQDRGLRL